MFVSYNVYTNNIAATHTWFNQECTICFLSTTYVRRAPNHTLSPLSPSPSPPHTGPDTLMCRMMHILTRIGNQIKIIQLANSKYIFSPNRSQTRGEEASRFYNLQCDTLALAVSLRLLKFISFLFSVCLFVCIFSRRFTIHPYSISRTSNTNTRFRCSKSRIFVAFEYCIRLFRKHFTFVYPRCPPNISVRIPNTLVYSDQQHLASKRCYTIRINTYALCATTFSIGVPRKNLLVHLTQSGAREVEKLCGSNSSRVGGTGRQRHRKKMLRKMETVKPKRKNNIRQHIEYNTFACNMFC